MGSGPLEIDVKKIAEMQGTTLEQALQSANTVRHQFDEQDKDGKHPHVRNLLDLIVRATDLAAENLRGQDESKRKGIEYHQAATAMVDLGRLLEIYVKDPKDDNFKKVSESCGHIIDRVSQKVLEAAGRQTLNAFMESLGQEQKKLLRLYESLHQSALALQSFVKDQSEGALHAEFSTELKKVKRAEWIWFCITAVSTAVLLAVAVCGLSSLPEFLSKLILPATGTNTFLFLAAAPRLLISAILLVVSFSAWRVFQTYKHIEVGLKRKVAAARIIPTLVLGEDVKTKSEIKQAFLKHILESEETGFIAQAKAGNNPILDSVKGK